MLPKPGDLCVFTYDGTRHVGIVNHNIGNTKPIRIDVLYYYHEWGLLRGISLPEDDVVKAKLRPGHEWSGHLSELLIEMVQEDVPEPDIPHLWEAVTTYNDDCQKTEIFSSREEAVLSIMNCSFVSAKLERKTAF